MVLSPMLHRDKSIWGEDAEEFNPDHTTPERMSAIPPNAYKPFGTGQRACIGRQFALQEAVLVLGMLLQRFELIKDPNYRLHTKVTLTVKPADFSIQVRRRADRPIDKASRSPCPQQLRPRPGQRSAMGTIRRWLCCSGRTSGPRKALPLASRKRGPSAATTSPWAPSTITLSSCPLKQRSWFAPLITGCLQTTRSSSTIGSTRQATTRSTTCRTPFSAVATPSGRRRTRRCPLSSMQGSSNTARQRIHPRGAGDARGDFDAAYRNWHDTFWKDIDAALGVDVSHETDESQPRLSITVTNRQVTNPVIMSYHAQAAVVRDNRELLGAAAGRSTRHVEVALPSGVPTRQATTLECCRATTSTSSGVSCCTSVWTPAPTSRSSRTVATTLICPPTSQPPARHPGQLRRASGSGNPRRHRGDGALHQ